MSTSAGGITKFQFRKHNPSAVLTSIASDHFRMIVVTWAALPKLELLTRAFGEALYVDCLGAMNEIIIA